MLIASAICFSIMTPAAAAPPPVPGRTASLREQQRYHDSRNGDSALHDTQARPDADCDGQPAIHESRPAPDKTRRRGYRLEGGYEQQRNENPEGPARGGNQGYEKIFFREIPKYPETRLLNSRLAMAPNWTQEEFIQIMMSPQAQLPNAVGDMQAMEQGIADATANAGLDALDDSMNLIGQGNINIANEASGTPGSTRTPFRPVSQAVWMVQQMFKNVYMPMSLLLLLPGAIILNTKGLVNNCINKDTNDEDIVAGPFTAILRTVIAIFLIPATQLILSYSIDVGNSLTYEVAQQIQISQLTDWARGQQEAREAAAAAQMQDPRLDPQPYSQQTLAMAGGVINMTLNYGILVLLAFQMVMSCYLMLMGPIAAALYAWPGGVGQLFRPVFVNWVNAVISLSLWRFWWLLIVLVMITRIQWLKEIGEYVPNTEWEGLMFGCFLVMMNYLPFAPFELKPGELVDKLLEKAKEVSGGGAADGGGGQKGVAQANPAPKAV